MPPAAFLANFGLFVEPDFLDSELRSGLRAEMERGQKGLAGLMQTGSEQDMIELKDRSTRRVMVSPDTVARVSERLKQLAPALESHFGVELSGECQEPQFLTYQEGDFFHAHIDGASGDRVPTGIRERKVSTVLFVNGEALNGTDAAGSYGGGELVFYGLLGDERTAEVGIPLNGRAGELVAFRSDMMHEVNPVTRGERHTIVSWFT
jgi:SM-20-related protein